MTTTSKTEDGRRIGLSVRWLWVIDAFKRRVYFVWRVKRLRLWKKQDVLIEDSTCGSREVLQIKGSASARANNMNKPKSR